MANVNRREKSYAMHQPGSLFKVAWLRFENSLSNPNSCCCCCCCCSSSWVDWDCFCKKHLWRFLLKGEGRYIEVNKLGWRLVWWNGGAFHNSCCFLGWLTSDGTWKKGGWEEEEDDIIILYVICFSTSNQHSFGVANLNKKRVHLMLMLVKLELGSGWLSVRAMKGYPPLVPWR